MNTDVLFVYGTLRLGSTHPLAVQLNRTQEYIGQGWVQGRLFEMAGYPGLVDSTDPNDRVVGDLFHLQTDAILSDLDAYEGCSPRDPKPHDYRRVQRTIHLYDGSRVTAWVYLYTQDTAQLKRLESGDYYSFL